MAISFPGIVDSVRMKPISINAKFNDAIGFDFTGWAVEKWGCDLIIENDARCALIGEWQYGAGQGFNSLVMVTLGTGVGSSALIEGKLLRGRHFQAGCLGGHFTIDFKGGNCNCGNAGCVETIASTWSLQGVACQHPSFAKSKLAQAEEIDYKLLFSLYRENDPAAIGIATQSMDAWSAAVINLVHAYDPEMVIIGGGIMKSSDIILPYITDKVHKHAWTPWGKVKITSAFYSDSAALPGSAYIYHNGANLYL
jgi:glucokinase